MRACGANLQHAATKVTNGEDCASMFRQFISLVPRNDDSSVRLEYKAFYFICFVKTFCGNIYTIKLHEYIIYTGVPNEKQSSEKRNALGEA